MKGYHRPKAIRTLIGIVLGLGATHFTYAASLGPIHVNSYMGQPLNASIRVSGLTPAEAKRAIITLADNAEYSKRGVVRTAEQSSLMFRLVPTGNTYAITVTSRSKMNEPFINFVLSFKNNGEVHNREYSVFLDPDPTVKAGIAPIVAELPATPIATRTNSTVLEPISPNTQAMPTMAGSAQRVMLNAQPEVIAQVATPTHHRASTSRSVSPHVSIDRISGNRYGPVRNGETLYSIANATRPSHVPVQTMMRAIFNANRRAFVSNSMDSLMAGQTLIIPGESSARTTKSRTGSSKDSEETRPSSPSVTQRAEPKVGKELIDTITENTSVEDVLPVEILVEEAEPIKVEEISAAVSETAEVVEMAVEKAIDSVGEMVLDGADSINQNIQTAIETSLPEVTAEIVQPKLEEIKVEPIQETVAQPQAVSPKPVSPAVTPPMVEVKKDDGFLFGLPLWAVIALGGFLLFALLPLVVIAALKKRKASASDHEMSEEEIQAYVNSLEEQEKRLTSLIDTDERNSKESSYTSFDNFSNSENADDAFFSTEDEDTFTSEVDFNTSSEYESFSSFEAAEFESADDFFTDDGHEDAFITTNIETDFTELSFNSEDDFFDDSETTSVATEEEISYTADFSNIDDFFTEAEPVTEVVTQETTLDDFVDVKFEGLDDFFTDSLDEKVTSFEAEVIAPIETAIPFKAEVTAPIETATSFKVETTPINSVVSTQEETVVFDEISLLTDPPEAFDIASTNTPVITEAPVKTGASAADIESMGITLDLASAYFIGGKVKPEKVAKVRSWLEDVLAKGSEEQKKMAAELIAKLD